MKNLEYTARRFPRNTHVPLRLVQPGGTVAALLLSLSLAGCGGGTPDAASADNGAPEVRTGPDMRQVPEPKSNASPAAPDSASTAAVRPVSAVPDVSDLLVAEESPSPAATMATDAAVSDSVDLRRAPDGVAVEPFRELFPGTKQARREWQAIVEGEHRVNHGVFREYYRDGKLREQGLYDHGKRTGLWVSFHADGKTPQDRGNYKDGKKTGLWERFHTNGKLAKAGNYVAHKVDGTWKKYTSGGVLTREESYRMGKRDGVWKMYDETGRQVISERAYADDKMNGVSRDWYASGQLKTESTYQDGELHGVQKVWHANGQLQAEIHYAHNKLHGTATSWNEQGNVSDQKKFVNGVPAAE